MPTNDDNAARDTSGDGRPLVEIGVLVIEDLEGATRRVLDEALASLERLLRERFPAFRWELPVIERRGPLTSERVDPGELLFEGVHERDGRHWDLAFVVTGRDLQSHYKPYALAVPSRSTGIAVVSLARLVGRHGDEQATAARRVLALFGHVLGDLLGVPHGDDPMLFSFAPRELADLERMERFPESAADRLEQELREIADTRLEERSDVQHATTMGFYLRATWHGIDDILSATVEARPWELPFRLSRLTAAAAATTIVLTLTAEAWDLGLRQAAWVLGLLAAAAIAFATVFVLKRQGLLLRRSRRAVSEQIVVMNVSIAAVVCVGLAATWALLWLMSVTVSWTLFDAALVREWSPSVRGPITFGRYATFGMFVATAGTLIGALGTTFEGPDLVRHVVFADEET